MNIRYRTDYIRSENDSLAAFKAHQAARNQHARTAHNSRRDWAAEINRLRSGKGIKQ